MCNNVLKCVIEMEKGMKHKLDILIPHYKEPFEVLKPMLDSIELQQSVNFDEFGVIIVNDGNDVVFDKSLFEKYSYSIKYYIAKHKGVSATRNACLDHSKADFVMFNDCDDMYYTNTALWSIFREINTKPFDTFASAFVEETVDSKTGEHLFIIRGDAESGIDGVFVHGKVHRRQFLIDKKIRWNEKLTIHEDSYFNTLCQKLAGKNRFLYCPTPFYIWRWREDSVCRGDLLYLQKTYNAMLDSSTELVNELLRRRKRKDAEFYAVSMIFNAYYTMNTEQWLKQENKEYRDKTEKRFKEYYLKFKYLYEGMDEQTKYFIIAGVRNRFFQEGLLLETQTFDQWIAHILTL